MIPMDHIETVTPPSFMTLSDRLREAAQHHPYKKAIAMPSGMDKSGRTTFSHLSFGMLHRESDAIAHKLECAGVQKGMRAFVMLDPGPDYLSFTYALLKLGAVPVITSPGLSRKSFLECMTDAAIDVFIGSAGHHMFRLMNKSAFGNLSVPITVGQRLFWGGHKIIIDTNESLSPEAPEEAKEDDPALIFFTPGVTGRPKGVHYTHSSLTALSTAIGTMLDISPGDLHMVLHPLVVVLSPAMGVSAVMPDVDLDYLLEADMGHITDLILKQGVTHIMASPSLLSMIGDHLAGKETVLSSLKKLIVHGTHVIPEFLTDFLPCVNENTDILLTYGAAETFPVCVLDFREMLEETKHLSERGFGACIGRPVRECDLVLISRSDDAISRLYQDMILQTGDVGEILVRGMHVSTMYVDNPKADAYAKVKDDREQIWHRTGDLAWRDKKGRLWFCGRKSQTVTTKEGPVFTISCETIFNMHPDVHRSALVGIGTPSAQTPVMFVELDKKCSKKRKNEIHGELLELAKSNDATHPIDTILFYDTFPVDGYHFSKILREELAAYAEKKLMK